MPIIHISAAQEFNDADEEHTAVISTHITTACSGSTSARVYVQSDVFSELAIRASAEPDLSKQYKAGYEKNGELIEIEELTEIVEQLPSTVFDFCVGCVTDTACKAAIETTTSSDQENFSTDIENQLLVLPATEYGETLACALQLIMPELCKCLRDNIDEATQILDIFAELLRLTHDHEQLRQLMSSSVISSTLEHGVPLDSKGLKSLLKTSQGRNLSTAKAL